MCDQTFKQKAFHNDEEKAQGLSLLMNQMVLNRTLFFLLDFNVPAAPLTNQQLIPTLDHFFQSFPICYSLSSVNTPDVISDKGACISLDESRRQSVKEDRAADALNESTLSNLEKSSISVANIMVNFCGLNTMLNVSCNVSEPFASTFQSHIDELKKVGVRNILLTLLNDCSKPIGTSDFKSSLEYISFVRNVLCKKQDGFTIGLIAHIWYADAEYEQYLAFLKQAYSIGIDFIVTSVTCNAPMLIKFVRDCRCFSIRCPIVVQINPEHCADQFITSTKTDKSIATTKECSTSDSMSNLSFINPRAERCVNLCKQIIKSGLSIGFYFVTRNQKAETEYILRQLNLWPTSKMKKNLPWRQSAKEHRFHSESVRPIFWSTQVKGYLYRTSTWEQFPRFRWNDSSTTSNSLSSNTIDNQLTFHHWNCSKLDLLNQWGHELKTEDDVISVFVSFLSKSKNPKTDYVVDRFPWCEEATLAEETTVIADQLIKLNKRGVLTINSQPAVNGIPSEHPIFGWGPSSDGYIYQKAYLEFFIPTSMVGSLLTILRQYPRVSFHVVNKQSSDNDDIHNHDPGHSIAVTWGVFPGREIIQPTVVDLSTFRIWKNEAYDIWLKRWAVLYENEEMEQNHSYKLLKHISDTYSLVNIVDNDFQKSNCLFELLDKVFAYENRDYNQHQIFAV